VAEQVRQEFIFSLVSIDLAQLAAADAAAMNFHQNLTGLQLARKPDLGDDQRLALLDQDRSTH
jgi:hypothetical protein